MWVFQPTYFEDKLKKLTLLFIHASEFAQIRISNFIWPANKTDSYAKKT